MPQGIGQKRGGDDVIAEFFLNLVNGVLVTCPVLALPVGFAEAISFFISIVGYINIFLPVARLAPVLALIVLIRKWNIVIAVLRFILRFIPFIG